MADPLNLFALETLATMTGLAVNPMLATMKDIREAIDVYYGTGMDETINEMVRTAQQPGAESVEGAEDAEGEGALSASQAQPVVRLMLWLDRKRGR